MKKKFLIGLLVVMCFTLTGCGEEKTNNGGSEQGKNTDTENTITCSLKGYSNENTATVTFENGVSTKVEVKETLGYGYSDSLRESERKENEKRYGEATLDGEVLSYTMDGEESSLYLGVAKADFKTKWCKQ